MVRRRLLVDWPACTATGACAAAAPAVVRLDEWGYPLIGVAPVPTTLDRDADRAVTACPTRALRLVEVEEPVLSRRARRRTRAD